MPGPSNSVRCPVCSSRNLSTLYPDTLGQDLPAFNYQFTPDHGRTYEILRCGDCTHAFSVPPRKDMWQNYEDVVDPAYLERSEERQLTFPQVLRVLAQCLPMGRLLDIGCATGDFLEVASRNYQVEGLEPSQWSADIARRRGFIIHNSRLGELPSDPGYDIVTLWGVIEHFDSLKEDCSNIHRILKPGGLVAVWTGDRCSWLARLFGRKWWWIQGQHMQFFSRKSLLTLFSELGFEPVYLSTYPFTTNFHLLTRSMGKYKIMGSLARIFLDNRYMARTIIRLPLPSEIFAIFRKK
jgi:SAM-dependent methyltransferase